MFQNYINNKKVNKFITKSHQNTQNNNSVFCLNLIQTVLEVNSSNRNSATNTVKKMAVFR